MDEEIVHQSELVKKKKNWGLHPIPITTFWQDPPNDLYVQSSLRNCTKRLKVDVAGELR